MRALCPHCQKFCEVSKELIGKVFICPSCGDLFPIGASQASQIGADAAKNRVCPGCGWLLEPGEVLCVKCGLNLVTGEALKTETDPKAEELAPLPLRILSWLADIAPGLFMPMHLVLFVLCVLIALFLAFMSLIVLFSGAFFSGIAVGAGAMMVYAQGVAWLFCSSLLPLKAAMVEIEGDQWTAFMLVTLAPFLTLIFIIFFIGRYVNQGG